MFCDYSAIINGTLLKAAKAYAGAEEMKFTLGEIVTLYEEGGIVFPGPSDVVPDYLSDEQKQEIIASVISGAYPSKHAVWLARKNGGPFRNIDTDYRKLCVILSFMGRLRSEDRWMDGLSVVLECGPGEFEGMAWEDLPIERRLFVLRTKVPALVFNKEQNLHFLEKVLDFCKRDMGK